MGRDWAPFEHYLSEQHQIKMGYGDLFDFLESLKMEYNGKSEVCCTPEEMAIRRQFPQLGRLMMNHSFMVLYEKLSKIEGGLDLLHQKDDELATVIENKGHGCDESSYLVKWFAGKLDDHFYHSERNDQLFAECMLDEAMILAREEYDVERFEAALQYASIDIDVDENREFFKGHANKLIYIAEHNKDLLDFDFWVRYELLLGEKITWDEYTAIDNLLDGDPHDVSVFDKRTIKIFTEKLAEVRARGKNKASLEENIQSAECMKVENSSSVQRDQIER